MVGNFYDFLLSAFFQNHQFQKNISVIKSECQTVWIHIRLDILSGPIWVQIVCTYFRQMTLADGLNISTVPTSFMNYLSPSSFQSTFILSLFAHSPKKNVAAIDSSCLVLCPKY